MRLRAAANRSSCSSIERRGLEAQAQALVATRALVAQRAAESFDVLVVWLASLQQQHGVKVEAATIDATATPGLVNASLTLTHGATAGP